MKNLRVGGVPEHFNFPVHLAKKAGLFEKEGLEVSWTDFPSGTGAMNTALRNNEIDVAIILTEGVVKDIAHGNPAAIIQTYVGSPLVWGIHVGAQSNIHNENELEGKRIAISRFGSGSHLMAHVHARHKNWDIKPEQFVVVNTLDGAIEALTAGTADYFMWEHFTTKPIVDQGIFNRVGDFPTPWPCFVFAARLKAIENQKKELKTFLEVINSITETFKEITDIDAILSETYQQKPSDIRQWLKNTSWSKEQLDTQKLNTVQQILKELKHIDKCYSSDYFLRYI